MSEDDRALKAARAKALLKKRQQQKAGVSSAEAGPPSLPPSRTSTPAPPSQPAPGPRPGSEKRDVGDLFSTGSSDSSWISSLPRAPSPPHSSRVLSPVAPKSPPSNGAANPSISNANGKEIALKSELASLQSQTSALKDEVKRFQSVEAKLHEAEARLVEERDKFNSLSKQFQESRVEKEGLIQNERQTVALLVSEKASLITELQRLEKLESEAQATAQVLNAERLKVQGLEAHFRGLEVDAQETSKRAQLSETQVKELTERCRDQERQLQLANASTNELRQESNQHQQKVRELQEQILNDDRVEKLEVSLRNTQNRADDLEFQLSKLTQAQSHYPKGRSR
ncbi:hypothetical protein BDN72DRAFT_47354 [Pluteus cervinus]|uniref:Uncharacterized protein n=1 Tax=Pluteus cervinus TaxID=181527 RepID=A0ACD3BH36_9AGAR|nr:hypothetical protein BDN72DRAFT_47354 [Pluteus cervinus]